MNLFEIIDIMEFDREFHDRYRDIEDVDYEDVSETECNLIEDEKEDKQTALPLV